MSSFSDSDFQYGSVRDKSMMILTSIDVLYSDWSVKFSLYQLQSVDSFFFNKVSTCAGIYKGQFIYFLVEV